MVSTDRKTAHVDNYCSTLCQENQVFLGRFIRNKLLEGVRVSTIMAEQLTFHSFFAYTKDIPLDKVTQELVEDWYLWFRDTPLIRTGKKPGTSTLSNNVSGVRMLLESVHGEEKTAQMFRHIKPVRVRKITVKEDELMTDNEIYRMLQACTGERDRAIIAVLASSGCRVGELCNMQIQDVRLYREKASLHLDGKTGPRDIDIYDGVPELKRWMQVHPCRDNPDAPLFVSKNVRGNRYTGITNCGVEKLLKRIAEKAEIPDEKRHNPHSFRHKRATDLADHLTTADLRVMFGWSDMSTTPNIYVHSSKQKVSKKLAQLAGVKIPEQAVDRKLVKYCPVCGCANSINDKWCNYCFALLDEERAEAKRRIDEFMMQKLKDKKEDR